MSSHREAPEISKDPVADSTDVYAFVSPKNPDMVTLIANYVPLQQPNGGPNFYEFGDDVLYEINIANSGKGKADISYQFRFFTQIRNPKTFLYNIGPISSIDDPNWNRPQFYSVTRVKNGKKKMLAEKLPCPPVNVGPRSTPDYAKLSAQAVHKLGKRKVFAGQRADAFHVDLGSVFDLGALRPFNEAHLIPLATMDGINSVQSYNVHSIAIEVPIKEVTRNGNLPTDASDAGAVIGVWTTAKRQKSRMFDDATAKYESKGPWEQVSRLGMPLVNEVLIPMADKDKWNHTAPRFDKRFARYVNKPELAVLLPVLYPGVFPNLAKYGKNRADLNAILLTGIPSGVVPGFQNYTGPVESDMLRLNVAIKPTAKPNDLGLAAGDAAGFPNGRRVNDDVVTVELRAIAGLLLPLVDKSFTPDAAASAVTDGTTVKKNARGTTKFPYLNLPGGGYQTKPGTTKAS
ncbi:MAG: DUF4331 domain-containing protein [Nocardioides sp.]